MKILGTRSKGKIFILSGPAGVGKTTFSRMLTNEFSCVIKNITYTTRKPRSNEKNGKDYHFVSEEQFKKMDLEGKFVETAKIYGNLYGCCLDDIEKLQNQKKHVLLVIDVQGAESLRDQLKAIFIFISPPSKEELKKRLKNRRTESEKDLMIRLENAEKEMQAKHHFDYDLINDDIHQTYEVIKAILIAEEHRI